MQNYFTLSNLWVLDLSEFTPKYKDNKQAQKFNLFPRFSLTMGEWVVIGSYNNILSFVHDYMATEDRFDGFEDRFSLGEVPFKPLAKVI